MKPTEEWLDRLGGELMRAISKVDRKRAHSPRNRQLVTVAISVGLVSAFAGMAIAGGIWQDHPVEPTHDSGIVAELGEEVTNSPGEQPENAIVVPSTCNLGGELPRTATGTPDESLMSELAVLRRPGPNISVSALPGVPYRGYARKVSFDNESSFVVAPVTGSPVNADRIPNTSDCRRFKRFFEQASALPDRACVTETGIPDGGQTCGTVGEIRRGSMYVIEDDLPGTRPGTARIFGLAPDGVRSVTLTIRTGRGPVIMRAPVIQNVFEQSFNGSAAVPPEIALDQ